MHLASYLSVCGRDLGAYSEWGYRTRRISAECSSRHEAICTHKGLHCGFAFLDTQGPQSFEHRLVGVLQRKRNILLRDRRGAVTPHRPVACGTTPPRERRGENLSLLFKEG
jgi:hypothetical protein